MEANRAESTAPSLVRFRMLSALNLLSFVIASLAGWLSEHQQRSIEYLVEENRVLREQIGKANPRPISDQAAFAALKVSPES